MARKQQTARKGKNDVSQNGSTTDAAAAESGATKKVGQLMAEHSTIEGQADPPELAACSDDEGREDQPLAAEIELAREQVVAEEEREKKEAGVDDEEDDEPAEKLSEDEEEAAEKPATTKKGARGLFYCIPMMPAIVPKAKKAPLKKDEAESQHEDEKEPVEKLAAKKPGRGSTTDAEDGATKKVGQLLAEHSDIEGQADPAELVVYADDEGRQDQPFAVEIKLARVPIFVEEERGKKETGVDDEEDDEQTEKPVSEKFGHGCKPAATKARKAKESAMGDEEEAAEESAGETYTLQELQQLGIIDNKVAEWITENPLPEDDPLLCLEYYAQNVYDQRNLIQAALVGNGNGNPGTATLVTSTVFKFDTMDDVELARNRMKEATTWAFYQPGAFPVVVPAILLNQPGQWAVLPQARTIGTKLIMSYSGSKYNVLPNYEFFKF